MALEVPLNIARSISLKPDENLIGIYGTLQDLYKPKEEVAKAVSYCLAIDRGNVNDLPAIHVIEVGVIEILRRNTQRYHSGSTNMGKVWVKYTEKAVTAHAV